MCERRTGPDERKPRGAYNGTDDADGGRKVMGEHAVEQRCGQDGRNDTRKEESSAHES